jgi:hypothetical protein
VPWIEAAGLPFGKGRGEEEDIYSRVDLMRGNEGTYKSRRMFFYRGQWCGVLFFKEKYDYDAGNTEKRVCMVGERDKRCRASFLTLKAEGELTGSFFSKR